MLPKIIDLFSGCGGLAYGFEKAGFEITAGIELMPKAVQTVTKNLNSSKKDNPTHICGDITKINENIFSNKFGDEGCIVIGGPPCQAYSKAGKGKLKSLGENRIHTKDSRGYLYQDFLRFAIGLDARAIIMENVPESINFGDQNIPQTVCELLEKKKYTAYWTILNSADFGTPQIRERVFVIAIKKSEKRDILLPNPTHKSPMAKQSFYERQFQKMTKYNNFKAPLKNTNASNLWVTVGDAFSDLPKLFPSSKLEYKRINMNEKIKYYSEAKNDFQKLMRTWNSKPNEFVNANSFRNTRRDFMIFEQMQQDDNFVNAYNIATNLFIQANKKTKFKIDSEEYLNLKKLIIPPYDIKKFENKWKKLNSEKPSHTLVAHLSKDTYSHIHPWEPRGITVREAARLQSFPDCFEFDCPMGDAYKQIGNAVPPLLALNVAKSIYKSFKKESE